MIKSLRMHQIRRVSTVLALLVITSSTKVDAASIIQSLTQTVSSSGTDFALPKFDPTLGKLTGVFLTIVSSSDAGSFTVANQNANAGSAKNPTDFLSMLDYQGSGGDYNGSSLSLPTNPSTSSTGFTVLGNREVTFALVNTPISLVGVGNIGYDLSASKDLYDVLASGSSDDVIFGVSISPQISLVGSSISADLSGIVNTTSLRLTYNYTPTQVPEPSSLVFIAASCGAVVLRRRRN